MGGNVAASVVSEWMDGMMMSSRCPPDGGPFMAMHSMHRSHYNMNTGTVKPAGITRHPFLMPVHQPSQQ